MGRNVRSHQRARKRLLKRLGYKNSCQWCGKFSLFNPQFLELHHIVRVVDGGNNSDRNLILLCSRCHIHADKQSERVGYIGSGAEFLKDTYK